MGTIRVADAVAAGGKSGRDTGCGQWLLVDRGYRGLLVGGLTR